MRHLEFAYAVSAEVEFTLDEIEHLIALSARHYDDYYRSLGRVGGFVYGFRVAMTADTPPDELPLHRVSIYEVDTMCKLLELELCDADPKLSKSMHTLFADMRVETRRVNGLERWPNAS